MSFLLIEFKFLFLINLQSYVNINQQLCNEVISIRISNSNIIQSQIVCSSFSANLTDV